MAEEKGAQGTWLKVFCPDARCLSEEEVLDLPDAQRQAAVKTGKDGLWLQVFCPDQSCLTDAERGEATRPASPAEPKGGAGFWLSLFCPDDQCKIKGPGDLG